MKVKKRTLLLIACFVWGIAGFNVLRIGILAYPPYLSPVNFLLSGIVFAVFQYFIFERIKSYREDTQFFLKFFDVKSFLIMAFMISGGIYLRASSLAPEIFIAIFYTGLGASLFLAGILFGKNYWNYHWMY